MQARQGFLGRYKSNSLVGFTIDLPPGWSIGESWPRDYADVFTGWIAGPPDTSSGQTPVLNYTIGGGPAYAISLMGVDRIKGNPKYELMDIEVEGVAGSLRLAAPEAINQGPQIGVFFERIPGAPDGSVAPSLDINGNSRGFNDQELLGRILRSIRYSELISLPELPAPAVIAGSNWARVDARSDLKRFIDSGGNFSLRLPPGWTTTKSFSYDSAAGVIVGDGIELSYDFLPA